MARTSPERHAQLESFWRFHHDEWVRGRVNQREYYELHGLPLKQFGNWHAQFKGEVKVRKPGLSYRRGGLGHMPDKDIGTMSTGYIPSASATPEIRRSFDRCRADWRNFTLPR